MKLTPVGRTALWVGCGGFLGLAAGGFITNPSQAVNYSALWLVLLAVFLGVVLGLARVREPKGAKEGKGAKATTAMTHLVPTSATALQVRFEFPDVPEGYPAVMGRGEPLHVRVRVFDGGAAAQGAAVQLSAAMEGDHLSGDGLTGSNGEVEFTLEPDGTGELSLVAEAKSSAGAGRISAVVSLVEYDAEVERLFAEFRAYAIDLLGAEAHADTARELCDKLRRRADPATARALLELARAYELVAYGQRSADRRLYLSVLEQLMVLEHAELPASLTREA